MLFKHLSALTVASLLSVLLLPVTVVAHGTEKPAATAMFSGETSAAAQAVKTFHTALREGNAAVARASLADDVLIVEGGGVERSADEYASHHMLSDMKFLAAVKGEVIEHQTVVQGDVAYSVSRTKMLGEYKGKVIDYTSKETLVLVKNDKGWRIVHIHWSR
jgi:ketosteroid isomerase-like protein